MEFLFEILGEFFIAFDGLTLVADLVSWIMGKENRVARREARRRGEVVPPRNNWNKAVVVFSVLFALITLGLVLAHR